VLTAAQNGSQIVCRIDGEPPVITVDRARVLQVLSNLIGNATKFTPKGGRITVALEPRADDVLISVTDTGIGISPQEIGRVFDRFWQAKKSKRGGAGLGLAISKAVVQAHGGQIWVESEEGRGSTFYCTLPVKQS
jgi:signal transduction histidine kinase